jgi:hypothetical protein
VSKILLSGTGSGIATRKVMPRSLWYEAKVKPVSGSLKTDESASNCLRAIHGLQC